MNRRPRKRARPQDVDPSSPTSTSDPSSISSASASTRSSARHRERNADVTSPDSINLVYRNSSRPPARRRRTSSNSRHSARTPSPVYALSLPGPVHGPAAPPRPHMSVDLFPVLPFPVRDCSGTNPFEDDIEHRLTKFVLGQHILSVEKPQVNGYVKLQFTSESRERYESERPERWWYRLCGLPDLFFNSLNPIDRRLFEFYVGSWCPGRTVLRRTNCWLTDIAQMAHKSDCVKSAIFALAGTYVVDYHPDEQVQNATLLHYKQAVLSLSLLLKLARQQAPEDRDGEALVAAIAILNMIDVVSPEQRRGQHLTPRWLDGAYLACEILDLTDPGHRYRDAANIQPSAARVGNTIIASRVAILALPMMPLDIANNGKHFGWLRQGPEVNIYRIHGGCGMSPALLSYLSQITHFAAMLHHDPIDTEFVAVQAAQATLTRLLTLPQWYEHETSADCVRMVSLDARTVGELLSHHLDEHGAIKTNEGMTASTAEAWRLAAIIYLQCRVFRLPRTHPDVLEQASSLAACIRLMPTSGYMFTAQTPFFPVFLLGIVAVTEEHSRCALQWFQSVISTRCRSSVPPAFEALERIRAWMTTGIKHDPLPVPDKVTRRGPWWEDVVAYIAETEGTLCLV